MRRAFARQRKRLARAPDYSIRRSSFELLDGFLFSTARPTRGAPHIRDSNSVQRLMNSFVIASLPCWLFGLWGIGLQSNRALILLGREGASGWRASLLETLGFGVDPLSVSDCFMHGLVYFLPVFLTALLVGACWEILFARYRRRRIDDGLLSVTWLYCLILPATVPLLWVALGMSVAIVIGKAIFGGTGRYLVSPAILGMAFLVFSYPDLIFGPGAWVPVAGYDDPTTIELYTEEGGIPALLSVGYSWTGMFFGDQPGPFGVSSLFACLLGAAYLILTGSASWRIMLGSLLGLIFSASLFNAMSSTDNFIAQVPWYWHLVTGGWAFGTVFLATDPVAASQTNPGRWVYGIAVGVLTIVIRVTNPAYYEGAVFAILLASVFAPLFDYVVIQRNIRRRRKRLEVSA